MKGVESVEIDREAKVVRVILQPGNRVRLEAVRDLIRGVGFTPTGARVRVRGRAVPGEAGWQFHVEGVEQTYRLTHPPDKGARAGAIITIEGTVPPQSDPRAQPELVVDDEPRP